MNKDQRRQADRAIMLHGVHLRVQAENCRNCHLVPVLEVLLLIAYDAKHVVERTLFAGQCGFSYFGIDLFGASSNDPRLAN